MFLKHRVLDKIILDKDTRFILIFWQVFTTKQSIKTAMLIAYYLQTDGQMERLN